MNTPLFSVIVPVFNRPDEVEELLQSLTEQTVNNFEVVIVEDGSTQPCEEIVKLYSEKLNIKYFFKLNSGPGTTRNYGAERSQGEYLIFFDSDCIIPPNYFKVVTKEISENPVDAFGGPDRAHESFTPTQKAINYSMTSFFTTGGIRGGKKKMDKFYPRSFNMGISSEVFKTVGGFSAMRFGEDVDLSLRIVEQGFSTKLFPEAYVYHKRRTDFKKFFKQVHNSGIARINLYLLHKNSLKLVHALPSAFVVGIILTVVLGFIFPIFFAIPLAYCLVVFVDSLLSTKSFRVATLSVPAAWVQLYGYGLGFLRATWKRLIFGRGEFKAFEKNFYK